MFSQLLFVPNENTNVNTFELKNDQNIDSLWEFTKNFNEITLKSDKNTNFDLIYHSDSQINIKLSTNAQPSIREAKGKLTIDNVDENSEVNCNFIQPQHLL